jgi:hypothetical protein
MFFALTGFLVRLAYPLQVFGHCLVSMSEFLCGLIDRVFGQGLLSMSGLSLYVVALTRFSVRGFCQN